MGRKKATRLRATPARLTSARMREDDKDDCIGNPFLLLFQEPDCLHRTFNMFSLEYKPGVSRGGRVICPISSLTMSQAFLRIRETLLDQREKFAQGANSVTRE